MDDEGVLKTAVRRQQGAPLTSRGLISPFLAVCSLVPCTQVETFSQKTVEFLIATFQLTKSTVETVIEVSTPVLQAAAPVVRDAAQQALEAATPVVTESAQQAAKFLEEQGVDLEPVVQASKVLSCCYALHLSTGPSS